MDSFGSFIRVVTWSILVLVVVALGSDPAWRTRSRLLLLATCGILTGLFFEFIWAKGGLSTGRLYDTFSLVSRCAIVGTVAYALCAAAKSGPMPGKRALVLALVLFLVPGLVWLVIDAVTKVLSMGLPDGVFTMCQILSSLCFIGFYIFLLAHVIQVKRAKPIPPASLASPAV